MVPVLFGGNVILMTLVTRDIINKTQFEALMSKNGITPDTEVILYGDFNNWFAAFVFLGFQVLWT